MGEATAGSRSSQGKSPYLTKVSGPPSWTKTKGRLAPTFELQASVCFPPIADIRLSGSLVVTGEHDEVH